MSGSSRRCAECIKSNVKCDGAGPSIGDWERLQYEEEHLSKEMELAISQAQEAMAKQLRLSNECVRSNAYCDTGGPSASDWDKLEYEERRLQAEEEEAMAKILRLRKQQQLFCSRAKDMLHRGLKTMDELDEAEEKECKEAEALANPPQSPSLTSPGHTTSEYDLFSALSPGFFDCWGIDSGTPPTTLGS
ncbi:hypothetical protein V491_00047 [Pseudogymnoascus sp. VKM F-3775]|nr:hypothetical protein V491_00047 [Pseudogymnoascus sp. VKM F-3775]